MKIMGRRMVLYRVIDVKHESEFAYYRDGGYSEGNFMSLGAAYVYMARNRHKVYRIDEIHYV